MADILITGGSGSFGRQLAVKLKDEGHALRIFDLPSCNYDFCKDWEKIQVFPGDILDAHSVKNAVHEVDHVFHLAAILPPASEMDREKTFKVNLEGTRVLLQACQDCADVPSVIFTSSVSTYGDTSREPGPIGPDHSVNPNDWYAESKVEAEQLLFSSGIPYVNLRISGVVIPAFLDPPEPWPFMSDQKIELVCQGDLTRAMVALAGAKQISNQTLIIAGGRSWQVLGSDYVGRWGEIMDIPMEEMRFLDRPGWLNWYDTSESQRLLDYQQTPLDVFCEELSNAVEDALA
jgi:nucleoside-diphosphate-sugar epimerase